MGSFESSLGKGSLAHDAPAEHSPVTRPTQQGSQLLQILLVRLIETILLGTIDVDLNAGISRFAPFSYAHPGNANKADFRVARYCSLHAWL